MKKNYILFFCLPAFVILIQFFRIPYQNPPVDQTLDFKCPSGNAPEKLLLLKMACYDCHSNETRYPWYAQIAPFSWRIERVALAAWIHAAKF